MRVLIIGVSGTGKTYLVERLKEKGLNAVDADFDLGITKVVDREDNEVPFDENGGDAFWSTHYYVFNLDILKKLLKENKTVYLFGHVAGQPGKVNGELDIMNLFDKVYYLFAPKELIVQRIKDRTNQTYGKHPEQLRSALNAKERLDKKAKELGLQIIDATLPAEEIIKIITS